MDIQNFIEKTYNHLKDNSEGNVADYIPQLAKVNPELFAISVCDINGKLNCVGDCKINFCLQSCCKPLLYCICRDILDYETIHKHVSHEPSGRKFNSFQLDKNNKPHNPMINAGAIMISSLIEPKKEPSERFDLIKTYLNRMAGGTGFFGFDNSVYLSEQTHADRNKALAYHMNEFKAFPKGTDLDKTLSFYFQSCSILSNTETLSIVAATLANNGICPITGEEIFDKKVIKDCLSLMYSCGMYDYSGTFAFEIGLPAKSGVSGCVMLIIPNKMGICIWSPKLDDIGNSVRGLEFCKRFIKEYPEYHVFYNLQKKIEYENKTMIFINAASNNNLDIMKTMIKDIDINVSDYDKRNALHLSCANGHLDIVKFLLDSKADINLKDRWGNTALHELKINKDKNPSHYNKIIQLFTEST